MRFKPCISSYETDLLKQITIKGSNEFSIVLPKIIDIFKDNGSIRNNITEFECAMEKDKFPIPIADDRENYHIGNDLEYWISGYNDFLLIEKLAETYGSPITTNSKVLEFGCASGRVLRHFMAQRSGIKLWGCDLKLRHIEWVRQHLGKDCRLLHNTTFPYIPIPDCTLDVFFAYSVFTHIDDFELLWLSEINRCLKTNGLAIVTIHSSNTWVNVPNLPLFEKYSSLQRHIKDFEITRELFEGGLPDQKTVLWWDSAANYNCDVYYSTQYIKNEWGRYFEIAAVLDSMHGYQDVVVLRKVE